MVIAMDQRYAGRSSAPASPFSYTQIAADQLAVLDAAGVSQASVMAAGIGCAHALRLIRDAQERITMVVCQDPIGVDETNALGTYYKVFHDTIPLARAEGMDAIIQAAQMNPISTQTIPQDHSHSASMTIRYSANVCAACMLVFTWH